MRAIVLLLLLGAGGCQRQGWSLRAPYDQEDYVNMVGFTDDPEQWARLKGMIDSVHAGYQTAEKLKQCPLGHAPLKNVPIVYGLIYETPEWREQLRKLEVWPGGCTASAFSPSIRVVCPTCGQSYDEFRKRWEGPLRFQTVPAAATGAAVSAP